MHINVIIGGQFDGHVIALYLLFPYWDEIKYDDDRPDGRHNTSFNVATDELKTALYRNVFINRCLFQFI